MERLHIRRSLGTLLSALLLAGCEGVWPFAEEEDSPGVNTAPVARVTNLQPCLTTRTLIRVDAGTSTDREDPDRLVYAMDFDSDGQVDTPWSTDPVLEFRLDADDWFSTLVVRDPQGLEGYTDVHLGVEPDLLDLAISPEGEVSLWHTGNGQLGAVDVFWNLELVADPAPRFDTVDPVRCWVLDGNTGDTLLAGAPSLVELDPPGEGFWVNSSSALEVSGIVGENPVALEDWPCQAPVRIGVELRGGQCGQVRHIEWGPVPVVCEP